MPRRDDGRIPHARIVAVFALTSLIVFVVIGAFITTFRARDVRAREERAAASRAELVANEAIGPELTASDLSGPVTGARYDEIQTAVRTTLLGRPRDPPGQALEPHRDGDVLQRSAGGRVAADLRGRPEGSARRGAAERRLRSHRGRERRRAAAREPAVRDVRAVPGRDERSGRRRDRGLPGLLRDPGRDRSADPDALDLARRRSARVVRRDAAADDRRHQDAAPAEQPAPGAGRPALRSVGTRTGHGRGAPRARPDEERLRRRHLARAANAADEHQGLRAHPPRVVAGRRSGRRRGPRGDRAPIEPAVPLDRERAPRVEPRARRRPERRVHVPVPGRGRRGGGRLPRRPARGSSARSPTTSRRSPRTDAGSRTCS